MLTVLGGLAEFERELIRARTSEGRERARARSVHMGRPPNLTPRQKKEALRRRDAGETTREFAVPVQRVTEHDLEACSMTAIFLRRIDAARNMRRFYRIDIEPDLFGGVF